MRRRRLAASAVALASLTLTAIACNGSDDGSPPPAAPSRTQDYLPDRAADIYLPVSGRSPIAVVVLVPGGGWQTAVRTGLGPLATRLARSGILAVNITYRAGIDRVRFPAPAEDIACATAFAAQLARPDEGSRPRLVLLGHSSGAQLAALVALSRERYASACRYPPASVDAFVGVSGPYDLRAVADVAVALFGAPPDQDPAAWRAGNPLTWASEAPSGLRVLLLHGDQDALVPADQSRTLAQGLREAGVGVDLRIVLGADHVSIFQPTYIAGTVISWIRGLPSTQAAPAIPTIRAG